MNFLPFFLINLLLFDCVSPFNRYEIDQFRRFKKLFKSVRPINERVNDKFMKYLNPSDQLEGRILLDFFADPSVFVTMLSFLEQMYLTFPFGFLLKPLVNFFRVPNRRRKRSFTLERIKNDLIKKRINYSNRSI